MFQKEIEHEIQKNVQEVNKKIDVAIFNSKGHAVSFEYQPSKYDYRKDIKISTWRKKSFELSGDGIILSKAIIAALPSGILGHEMLQTKCSETYSEYGYVKILIEISGDYARNRYDNLYVQNIASIVNGIKQHRDAINTLAQYIKKADVFKNPYRIRIYPQGIEDFTGEGGGNQRINFAELGMGRLDMVEGQYALAIVLVDWLNNELKEEGNTYYAEADYHSGWDGLGIYIREKTINSSKPNLKSWY